MVPHVAVVPALGASSGAEGRQRKLLVHGPYHAVDRVDDLFHELAAAQPVPGGPVAEGPRHVRIRGRAGIQSQRGFGGRGVIQPVKGKHASQFSGGKLAVGFLIRLVIAPAEPVQNHQIFKLCQTRGLQHGKHAGNVHRHGLLRINVLAGVNGRRQMLRTEGGRRAEQHHVNIRLKQLLVTVQAVEQAALVQLDAAAVLFRQQIGAEINPFPKHVRQRPDYRSGVGVQRVLHGAQAAASAAYQAHLERSCVRQGFRGVQIGHGCQEPGRSSGGSQKTASVPNRVTHLSGIIRRQPMESNAVLKW